MIPDRCITGDVPVNLHEHFDRRLAVLKYFFTFVFFAFFAVKNLSRIQHSIGLLPLAFPFGQEAGVGLARAAEAAVTSCAAPAMMACVFGPLAFPVTSGSTVEAMPGS